MASREIKWTARMKSWWTNLQGCHFANWHILTSMLYNKKIAILLGSLLFFLHRQPVAAWLRFLDSHENHPIVENPNHRPGRSGEIEGYFKGPEGQDETLITHSSSRSTADSKDSEEYPDIADDSHRSSQDAEETDEGPEDPEGFRNPSPGAEDLSDPEDTRREDLNDPEVTEDTRRSFRQSMNDSVGSTRLEQGAEGRSHSLGLFLLQLWPIIWQAFFSTIITHLFNWFYPFKVVPPPPGLLGVSQLWGGLPHPKHWHHHWGHLHQGPGKWGSGNWGHAYWGPAYSGQTPPAPPAHTWEPHPHAHV